MRSLVLLTLAIFAFACDEDSTLMEADATADVGPQDAETDVERVDATLRDSTVRDSTVRDSAAQDARDPGPQELKAFPSAFGAGAYATGGRGGSVYHVTSLLDDGSEGTLRWALGQPRPSTVVFDVSGTIDLQEWLTLSGSDMTIAGQTASLGGITITSTSGARFRGQDIHNFVIRYLRIRPLQSGDDAFEFYGNNEGAHTIILRIGLPTGQFGRQPPQRCASEPSPNTEIVEQSFPR